MSTPHTLQIPIHLDAYLVEEETLVTEAFADFSRLPHTSVEEDHNPDIANLSESVLSQPFQNKNLTLAKGIHLHWSLPDALTRGGSSGSAEDQLAVPNRWLIKRSSSKLGEKQWVVESDYLHPAGEENLYKAIAYPDPFHTAVADPTEQPFRYLGRQLDATNWVEETHQRLPKLTAVGYGEPAFAAFYSNCHSVFGCFDEGVQTKADLDGLQYEIVGWYSHTHQDPLREFTTEIHEITPPLEEEEIKTRIQEEFLWNVQGLSYDNLPVVGMTCYAQLTFDPNKEGINNSRKSDDEVQISMGNTGTEALSALLAQQIVNEDETLNDEVLKDRLEEQLEHLFLQSPLQAKTLDVAPRFKLARHDKGFNALKGGSLWQLTPLNENNEDTTIQLRLPSHMADTLNELNLLEQESAKLAEELTHLKRILFADWYKYMLCAYPPDDTRDQYPDIDLVRYYIEQHSLPAIDLAKIDFEEKQAAITVTKNDLEEQVANFNQSKLDSEPIFVQKLDDQMQPLSSNLILTGTDWEPNKPFSNECLVFDGKQVYATLSPPEDFKALSLWLNIATQQKQEAATLLAMSGDMGTLLSKTTIFNTWSKLSINGVELPSYQTLQWHDLPKDQWFHLYVEFSELQSKDNTLYLFSDASEKNHLSGKLAGIRLFNQGLSTDAIFLDQNMLGHQQYRLKEVMGPRFWQPNEPVVMINGNAVTPTDRHGGDGRMNEDDTLDCPLAPLAYPTTLDHAKDLIDEILKNQPDNGSLQIGYDTWQQQPWHPFLLEWEVELFPLKDGGNLSDGIYLDFASNFLTDNFTLDANRPKLTVKPNKLVQRAASIYSGRTILTPYAKMLSIKTIESYLKNIRQEDCYQASAIPETDKETYTTKLSEWFAQKPEKYSDFKNWYPKKPIYHNSAIVQFGNLDENEQLGNFNYSMIQMLNQLEQGHFLSQALSGFNNALLMHHQTLQLPIADPLGFADYQTFTTKIRETIGTHTNVAPLPLNDFLPLRSGTLRLLKLRITDTFGQHKDIEISNPIKAETSRLPVDEQGNLSVIDTEPYDVWLPPRFVQPARVNFRWLSADHERQELNSHPDSSPICGWILANHLDNSMAVYDQQGNALGYIDQEAQWRSNPGSDHPIDSRDLPNPTLVRLVQRLSVQENDDPATTDNKIRFFQDFISVTDKALESIDPESFMHHQELALLMGRPIAVVRATLGLELQASPAIHRGWTEFCKDLQRSTRETDSFEKVTIPMRIGEQAHRNDGVLGYWKEEAQELSSSFYTIKATTDINSETIKSYQDEPLHLARSLSEASQQLTMLIDPRAEAHVTTGVLPVKRIHIPKDQYAPALKKISINFLSTPILMPAHKVMLPLPSEHGYDWSWLAKDRFSWTEVARQGVLRKDTVIRTVKNGAALWQQLLDQGWLVAIDTNRARVVPSDQRAGKDLQPPFAKDADRIQQMLDAGHILPVHTQATFDPQQTIKEGWLKLSPIEQ